MLPVRDLGMASADAVPKPCVRVIPDASPTRTLNFVSGTDRGGASSIASRRHAQGRVREERT